MESSLDYRRKPPVDCNWETLLAEAKAGGAATQPPVKWKSEHWRSWLERQGTPAVKSAFEILNETYGCSGLLRSDIFDLAEHARETGGNAVMRFLLGIMLWGYAETDGRGPWRVAKMTAESDCEARVLSILAALDKDGVHEAYRRIQDRRRSGLPWLGASYGTKVLYFGGREATASASNLPLILDEFVARAFRYLEELDEQFHPGWCWRNYDLFMKRVGELAGRAEVAEDDIEYQLFELGKSLPANARNTCSDTSIRQGRSQEFVECFR